jgi:hypothetical protein
MSPPLPQLEELIDGFYARLVRANLFVAPTMFVIVVAPTYPSSRQTFADSCVFFFASQR